MKFSHTLKTSAPPERIWEIWTDVAHWSKWDSELPLCSLNIYRYLSSQSDITHFTHEVSFQGAFAFVFGLLLGRQFRAILPIVMENVKQIAETGFEMS